MSRTSDLVKKTLAKYKELKNSSEELNFFCNRLETTSNNGIALFSGAVRDWYLGYEPKDIDFVIDTPYFKDMITGIWPDYNQNSFGGYVFDFNGIVIDIWNLKDTFALKSQNVDATFLTLAKYASFNLDSMVIKLNGESFEYGFWDALDSKVISINNPKFRDDKKAAIRALKMKKKYSFDLSKELNDLIANNLSVSEISDVDDSYCPPTIQNIPEQLTLAGVDFANTACVNNSTSTNIGAKRLHVGTVNIPTNPKIFSKKIKSSNSP